MENNCLWRVEDVRGDWTGEQSIVRVPGGQQFKTWLGLSNTADERSVSALHGSAGTLWVSIETENFLKFEI
jgi:hypothetical protein